MVKKDYHIHTTYSDGKDTPREIIEYAITQGVKELGFSDHSYTAFDESWCIRKDKVDDYFNEITSLKKEYADKISILCGIEQDYYSLLDVSRYDYVIGSVHYLKVADGYIQIDKNIDVVLSAINNYFDKDAYKFIKAYYDTVSNVVEKTRCDIIGHFDLVSKFNEKAPFFNENDARYKALWKNALDRLLKTGKTFEINTGAIARGYKSVPYPNAEMIEYIKANGGNFIYSSDAHKKENICFDFDKLKKEKINLRNI